MKRFLQMITLGLLVSFIFTTTGFSQLIEKAPHAPAHFDLSQKTDVALLWDINWQDPPESTNGIISTLFGGLEPGHVVTTDDFVVPEGMQWTISSIWTRGFNSFDSETGEDWAQPDGFGFRLYADDNGAPGDLIEERLIEAAFDVTQIIELDMVEPLVLSGGTYWIGIYGYYESSSASNEGRFNQYMWSPLGVDVLGEPHLRDYADLFEMAADGWVTLASLGINFTALDFAIWGEEAVDDGNTVVDIIVGSEDHTTLATAVTLAGLVDALSGEGPFTVFAPTNAAFDALPEGLLDALLADPEGDLTTVLLYHVVEGDVMSGDLSDGQVITTLLGQELTVTIDGGVFINDVSGNSVEVTGPDLEADNGVVHVVDGVLIPDLTVSTYSVTFNVDMTDAVAVGDVAFDPEIHRVFLSGTFAGWTMPGEDDAYELLPADPAKSREEVVLFSEDFEPGNETGDLPDGWEVKKADNPNGDNLQDVGDDEAQWFRYSEAYDPLNFDAQYVHGGEASMWVTWNVSAVENAYAISPEFDLPDAEEINLEFWKWFNGWVDPDSGDPWFTSFIVLIHTEGAWTLLEEFIGNEETENLYAAPVNIDLSAFAGQGTARLAFIQAWNDGIQMAIDDITVTAVTGGTEPDNFIYTLTLDIEEGDQEYKYFLVEDAPTWDLGEAEGTNNREVNITDDVVFNDIWGDIPSFVDNVLFEDGLNLFPNPVRNTLYVDNSSIINEIRIYDLTGRLVMSKVVNDNSTSFNVSEFKTGVYVMQVISEKGVSSQKFNVTK